MILYKTASDADTVNKYITAPIVKSITPKGAYQIEHPSFTLHREEDEYFIGYNYAYIKELNSYYWVEITIAGALAVVNCNIDALMTHAAEIRGLNCLVDRQENVYNPYIPDPLYPLQSGSIVEVMDVGAVTGSSDVRSMYLTCVGGINQNNGLL